MKITSNIINKAFCVCGLEILLDDIEIKDNIEIPCEEGEVYYEGLAKCTCGKDYGWYGNQSEKDLSESKVFVDLQKLINSLTYDMKSQITHLKLIQTRSSRIKKI
jgi:hypothetical protein